MIEVLAMTLVGWWLLLILVGAGHVLFAVIRKGGPPVQPAPSTFDEA